MLWLTVVGAGAVDSLPTPVKLGSATARAWLIGIDPHSGRTTKLPTALFGTSFMSEPLRSALEASLETSRGDLGD